MKNNTHLARSKAAYKDSDVLPVAVLTDQLADYVFIHDTPEAKASPDHVPFDPNECRCAIAALEGAKYVDYRNFRQLVKNSWVRDEVWWITNQIVGARQNKSK